MISHHHLVVGAFVRVYPGLLTSFGREQQMIPFMPADWPAEILALDGFVNGSARISAFESQREREMWKTYHELQAIDLDPIWLICLRFEPSNIDKRVHSTDWLHYQHTTDWVYYASMWSRDAGKPDLRVSILDKQNSTLHFDSVSIRLKGVHHLQAAASNLAGFVLSVDPKNRQVISEYYRSQKASKVPH